MKRRVLVGSPLINISIDVTEARLHFGSHGSQAQIPIPWGDLSSAFAGSLQATAGQAS